MEIAGVSILSIGNWPALATLAAEGCGGGTSLEGVSDRAAMAYESVFPGIVANKS